LGLDEVTHLCCELQLRLACPEIANSQKTATGRVNQSAHRDRKAARSWITVSTSKEILADEFFRNYCILLSP
jgi:hypothetical protein